MGIIFLGLQLLDDQTPLFVIRFACYYGVTPILPMSFSVTCMAPTPQDNWGSCPTSTEGSGQTLPFTPVTFGDS